jgi:thiol-disulfide isomerase/thioredoxin
MQYPIRCVILLLFVLSFSPSLAAKNLAFPENEISVTTHDGSELALHQYPAKGNHLLIWIASGYGLSPRDIQLARGIARQGVEVWQIDFAQALFQVGGSNFMRNLDPRYVVDIIDAAHKQGKKQIVILSHSYGAIPALRGATLWQQHPLQPERLRGVILLSPDLYAAIPELGLEPAYLPIVHSTNIPMMIFQAGKRGNRGQFPHLLQQLKRTNNNVFFKILPDVTSPMYHGDTSAATMELLQTLPRQIYSVIRLFDGITPPAKVPFYTFQKEHLARLDSRLKPYRAHPQPNTIALRNIDNRHYQIDDYRGKVSIINFWASWCTPCVEEIPSLNRLRKKMQGKPFQLISINYAEDPKAIKDFLKMVNVEFPVLLDTTGEVAAHWKVIAFPSTFVIGSDGKIHYGVNAAIDWDAPEVIRLLEGLMPQ